MAAFQSAIEKKKKKSTLILDELYILVWFWNLEVMLDKAYLEIKFCYYTMSSTCLTAKSIMAKKLVTISIANLTYISVIFILGI